MRQLTKNFHEREFRCRCAERGRKGPQFCGGGVGSGIAQELADELQRLRDVVGKPLNVSSGYRCPAYNASLDGAASKSKHVDGIAADVWVAGMTSEQLITIAEANGIGIGRGVYPGDNFIHIDVRPGPVTRWAQVDGVYVAVADEFKEYIPA